MIKKIIFQIASVAVFPLVGIVAAGHRLGHRDALFAGCAQLLSLIPTRVGVHLRAAYCAHACTDVDWEVAIGFLTLLSQADMGIGRNVYIGPQSNLGSCSIGADSMLGSGVHVLSGKAQHGFALNDRPMRLQPGHYKKIRIGVDCWIGNGAIIMADIGDHSIVAAGAVVAHPLPQGSIAAGNPARILRSR